MLTLKNIQTNWSEIKDGLKTIWGDLEESELNQTKGDLVAIESMIKRKTFEPIKSIRKKLKSLMDSFDNETDKSHKLKGGISSYQRNPN
jgi:hypothetical protein